MSISHIIGKNIKKLMEQQNISLRTLGEAIGVSHPTLSKYVEGEQPINSEQLMKIATFFNVPFDYFFKEEHKHIQFLFRADKPKDNITPLDLNKLHKDIINYLDIVDERPLSFIPQKYNINQNANWEEIDKSIQKVVMEQRRLLNIENIIPDNYFKCLQDIGINVIAKDFNNDNHFGASSLSKEYGSFIFINDSPNVSEERKIFSLIHEFAHLLFHSEQYNNKEQAYYNTSRSDFNEKVANKFAGYFLMPKHLVDIYYLEHDYIGAFAMKKHFKVSLQTLYHMLAEQKRITKQMYRKFWITINGNNLKLVEPEPITPISNQDKNSYIYNKLKRLYIDEEISSSKINEVLGIGQLETRKLLNAWKINDERYLPR